MSPLRCGASDHLLLTDLVGATPCNVASQSTDGVHTRLLAGVNLPMLLRAVSYRHEALDTLCERAQQGGTLGVLMLPGIPAQAQQRSHASPTHAPVSYTHLTLPTNREV